MPYSSGLDDVQIDLLTRLQTAFIEYLPAIVVFILLVIGAFVVVGMARAWVKRWLFGPKGDEVKKAWSEVESHVAANDDMYLRMAIIKADAVLDMALRAKGFPGKSMNDRLNFAIHRYGNLRRVRPAHGLRNQLAHEPMKEITRREGLHAISIYRAALKEMGAL